MQEHCGIDFISNNRRYCCSGIRY